jgi:methionyl-tRNA synthetase
MPATMHASLEASERAFDNAFRLDAVSVRGANNALWSWIESTDVNFGDAGHAYGWLKGFAYFAFPLMPQLSMQVWKMLGAGVEPRRDDLLTPTYPDLKIDIQDGFQLLSVDLLKACLPTTMTHCNASFAT